MKKFTIIFFTFILLSLTMGTSIVSAEASKTFKPGIYNARDANLLIGTPITARVNSPNERAMVMIVDNNQQVQELVRLGPQSLQHTLKPLEDGSSIIIFGSDVIFS